MLSQSQQGIPPPMELPEHPYLDRLVRKAAELSVRLERSDVNDLWLYHPGFRVISVWEPDLSEQPLGFICVVFAHELGHVVDFDANPHYQNLIKDMHWSQVPLDIEFTAFMIGYRILMELEIPMSVEDYTFFISEPMQEMVRTALTREADCELEGQVAS